MAPGFLLPRKERPAPASLPVARMEAVRSVAATSTDADRASPPVSVPRVRPRRALLAGARTRILAGLALLLAVSTLVSLLLLRDILLSRLDEEIDTTLTQEVGEFRRLAGGNDPRTGRPFGTDLRSIFDVFFQRNVPSEGEIILSAVGGKLYRSVSARDVAVPPAEILAAIAAREGLDRISRGSLETSGGPALFVAVPVKATGAQGGAFVVANLPRHERAELEEAVRVAGAVSGVVFVLAFAVAWASAGRVLAPLRLVRETARSITEADLKGRIPVRGNDEVAQLAATFNEMLDRLESAFAAQRRFIDDAGHELRTPITIVRGQLEVLPDDPDERSEVLAVVTDELNRMSRLVNDMLVLARAEQPDFLQLETVEVERLASDIHAKVAALAPRAWRLESTGRGVIVADRERLTQAVVQLAENATKHTVEGDLIALGSLVADGEARFWVRDTGPGIEPDEQARIFQRFSRGAGARRTEGAGLGLSIVEVIARAHGGRVELQSRPGAGAEFTLVVPVDQPEHRSR